MRINGELAALAQVFGRDSAGQPKLLHGCRLHALGGEVFGHRTVIETLQRLPNDEVDVLQVVGSEANSAIFLTTRENDIIAYVGDCYAGGIGRLWRVGSDRGAIVAMPQLTSVPFDPALSQLTEEIEYTASDHPSLDAPAADCLLQLAREYLTASAVPGSTAETLRSTAFVVRAWSQAAVGAALLAVHDLTIGPQRRSAFRFLAVTYRYRGNSVLHSLQASDPVRAPTWRPRVVALSSVI